MKKLLPILFPVLLCTASAGVIVYDGFDYTGLQSLIGLSGGEGWNGAWQGTGTAPTVLAGNTFATGAFPAGAVTPTGRSVNKAGAIGPFSRPVSDLSAVLASGDDIWFQLLLNPRAQLKTGESLNLGFYDSTGTQLSGFGFSLVGEGVTGTASLHAYLGGGLSTASIPIAVGSVAAQDNHLLVGKLSAGATTGEFRFDVWLNPDLSQGYDLLTQSAIFATGTLASSPDLFGINSPLQINGSAEPFNLDEIVLKTIDSSAIPEPSSAAVLAGGVTLLLALHRRSRHP